MILTAGMRPIYKKREREKRRKSFSERVSKCKKTSQTYLKDGCSDVAGLSTANSHVDVVVQQSKGKMKNSHVVERLFWQFGHVAKNLESRRKKKQKEKTWSANKNINK